MGAAIHRQSKPGEPFHRRREQYQSLSRLRSRAHAVDGGHCVSSGVAGGVGGSLRGVAYRLVRGGRAHHRGVPPRPQSDITASLVPTPAGHQLACLWLLLEPELLCRTE